MIVSSFIVTSYSRELLYIVPKVNAIVLLPPIFSLFHGPRTTCPCPTMGTGKVNRSSECMVFLKQLSCAQGQIADTYCMLKATSRFLLSMAFHLKIFWSKWNRHIPHNRVCTHPWVQDQLQRTIVPWSAHKIERENKELWATPRTCWPQSFFTSYPYTWEILKKYLKVT